MAQQPNEFNEELEKYKHLQKKASELKKEIASKNLTPEKFIKGVIKKADPNMSDESVDQIYKSLEDPISMEKSKIITTINVWLVTQKVSKNIVNFLGQLPVNIEKENVVNGMLARDYVDFTDGNNNGGYEAMTEGDLNADTSILAVESYEARKQFSKAYKLYDSVLNDIAKDPTLFYAMINDITQQLDQPVEQMFYSLLLQAIVSPLRDYTSTVSVDPIDVSDEKPDIVFNAIDLKDLGSQVLTYFEKLKYVSRYIFPDRFTPVGIDLNRKLPYKPDKGSLKIIAPIQFVKTYQVQVNSGSFNMGEIDITGDLIKFDYSQFREWGKISGIKNTPTEFDMFLMQQGFISGIDHYRATQQFGTIKLYSLIALYARTGIALDKTYLYNKIRVKINDKAELSTAVTNLALGSIKFTTLPTDAQISDAVSKVNEIGNPVLNGTDYYYISDITETGATLTGNGTQFTGEVKVTFTKAV